MWSMEFLSALIGAIVGGAATFAASWWQTAKVLRHERDLAASARDAASSHEQQRVAVTMLEAIARMRSAWHLIRYQDPPVFFRMGAPRPPDPEHPALDALAELETLTTSQALLLPSQARARCLDLVALIREYRDCEVEGGWTEQHLRRASEDTLAFMDFVQSTLNELVLDGQTIEDLIVPPDLSRYDLKVWSAWS
jgi:hypothetical protein